MIGYKNINDRLTINEFNGIISLLRKNTVLYDEFILENNTIGGKYGSYDISLNMASILDNGILISNNANNLGTIELKDKLFSDAKYTLSIIVFFKDNDNLGFNDEINECKLNIVLEENVPIDIDFETFERQIIVGFNAVIIINFDAPIITGDTTKYVIKGKIQWNDYDNEYEFRPDGVTVRLFAGGTEINRLTVTEDDNWRYKFSNLEKYVDNRKIRYAVNCDPTEYYMTTIENFTIIEECYPPLTSVSAFVVWGDDNNLLGIRPNSVALTLSNGEVFVANEANGWSVTRSDLVDINRTYSWEIQEVIGYTVSEETVGSTTIFTLTVIQRPPLPDNPKPKTPGDDYDTPL